MKTKSKKAVRARRRIETFEPCGPVAQMIDNELRSMGPRMKTQLFERCLVGQLRAKYPKLALRYDVLQEEAFSGTSRRIDAAYRAEVGRGADVRNGKGCEV